MQAIFDRYASDPEVVRYMSWPRHRSLDDTRAFLALSDEQWRQWEMGPLLAFSRSEGTLLGSAGFVFERPLHAITGYVFARDAWGHGYATEALLAMVELGRSLGLRRLEAQCHVDHRPSQRVLEKAGFRCEGVLERQMVFPNLSPEPADVLSYSRVP